MILFSSFQEICPGCCTLLHEITLHIVLTGSAESGFLWS
jgi:hypothetical protein